MAISFTLATTQPYIKMAVPRKEQWFLNFEPKCHTLQTISKLQMQFLMQSNPLSNLFSLYISKLPLHDNVTLQSHLLDFIA